MSKQKEAKSFIEEVFKNKWFYFIAIICFIFLSLRSQSWTTPSVLLGIIVFSVYSFIFSFIIMTIRYFWVKEGSEKNKQKRETISASTIILILLLIVFYLLDNKGQVDFEVITGYILASLG